MKYTREYIKLIQNGEIVINKWIQKQLNRMLRFEQKYTFKQDEADFVIDFLEMCPNPQGHDNIKLFLEQKVWIEAAFGFWYFDTHHQKELRLSRENVWQISRGSGKTTLASGLGLYGTVGDGEEGAEVYCMGTTNDQAKKLFDAANAMRVKNKSFNDVLHKSAGNRIDYKAANSFLRILTNDYGTMDGLNHHLGIFDEVHAYKEDTIKVFNDGGFRKRLNPLTFYITTNGVVRGLVYDKMRKRAMEVLNGEREDDHLMVFLYELDDIEEINDESKWQKAIPLLDKLISRDVIRRDLINSQDDPADQAELLTKTFGMAVNSYHSYLSDEECQGNREKFDTSLFEGTNYEYAKVVCGADLSQVNDLCSINMMTLDQDENMHFKSLKFIPRQGYEKVPKKWKAKYDEWSEKGILTIHDYAYNDIDFLWETYIQDYFERHKITPIGLGYDPYQAQKLVKSFGDYYGVESHKVAQNVKNLSQPTKEIKALLRDGKIIFDDEVTTWNFRNLVVKIDANNNVYPNKKEANEKIDEFISLMLAYICYKENRDEYINQLKRSDWLSQTSDEKDLSYLDLF